MSEYIFSGNYILNNGGVSANSPLSGDGTNVNPLGVVASALPYNETVLYEFTGTGRGTTGTYNLSETWKHFDKIRISEGCVYGGARPASHDHIFDTSLASAYSAMTVMNTDMTFSNLTGKDVQYFSIYGYSFSADNSITQLPSHVIFMNWASANQALTGRMTEENSRCVYKIVGINRKV